MENTCENIQEQILELITGTLSAEKAAELQHHISQCPACRKYLQVMQADDKLLSDFVGSMQPTVTRLESNVIDTLNRSTSDKAANFASIWRTIMRSRVTKFNTAAVIIIAALIAVKMLSGPDEQPSRNVLKKYDVPNKEFVVKQAGAKLDVELENIEQMFKARNLDGLVAMLSEGEFESKIASANYLAKMGAVQALGVLENLNAQHYDGAPDNPFGWAIEEIKKHVAAESGKSSPGTVIPRVDSAVADKGVSSIVVVNELNRGTRERAIHDSAMRHELMDDVLAESFQAQAKEVADGYPIKRGGNSIAEVVPTSVYQNLVLYYSFYTGEDPNIAVDISGGNFHGRVHGAKYAKDEILGGTMSFDGEDDYISIPDVYLEGFSIAAWVKTPQPDSINNRRIFTLYEEGHCYAVEGNTRGGISIGAENMEADEAMAPPAADETTTGEADAEELTGAESRSRQSSYEQWARSDWANDAQFSEYDWRLKARTWTHITVTYDGATGRIYRNGRVTEVGRILTEGFTGTAYIGGIEIHNGGFWHGMIDEVALFNRALTEEDVVQLYSMTGEAVEVPEVVEESGIVNVEDELVEVDAVSSVKHTVAIGFSGDTMYPADVDGDGDLDVVGAAEGHEHRLFISTRSGVSLSSRPRPEVVDSGEDDEDRAAGISWWENTDGKGTAWAEHIVDANISTVRNAYPTDVDLDGDVDIIGSASANDLVWWENSRGDGKSWFKHLVDGAVGGVQLVHGADIDGDGYMDVVGATFLDGGINWWENASGNGTNWQKHTIDDATNADYCRTHCLCVADMDCDGKLDIVASAGRESGINWWENPEDDDAAWTRHYVVGSDGEVESVYPADLDGDGDTDIIGSIRRHDGLTWWENTNGAATEWTKHIIDSSYHAEQVVDAADMDGDGDVDILAAAQRINAMIWWENKNGKATEWSKHVMSKNFGDAYCAYAADIDKDGDLDILGVGRDAGEIAWFEN